MPNRTIFRSLVTLLSCFALSTLSVAATAATWIDWSSAPVYGGANHVIYTAENPLQGSLGGVTVEFSGEVYNQSCLNGGGGFPTCPVWTLDVAAYATAYIDGLYVTSVTGLDDHIALTGGNGVVRYTIKFSEPVSDVVLAVWSLGNPSTTEGRWKFFQPWELIAQTSSCGGSLDDSVPALGAAASHCLARVDETNSLSGKEGDGVIIFPGENTEISWEITSSEVWAAFNLGVAEASFSDNNAIVYVTAADRTSVEGVLSVPGYKVSGLAAGDTIAVPPTCAGYTDLNFDTSLSTSTPAGSYVTHCSGMSITDNDPANNYVTLYVDGSYTIRADANDDGVPDTANQTYVDWTSATAFNAGSGPGAIAAVASKGNAQGPITEGLLGGFGTFSSSAVNYPETWFSPIPVFDVTEYSSGNIVGAGDGSDTELESSIDVTVTFSEAVPTPRFHFVNLDNNQITFLGSAGDNLSLISGNNEFVASGADLNIDDAGTAGAGDCEASDGSNPNGACGTVELAGSYTSVSFRVTAARGSGGDGWSWTVSTPTWTVTPSTDANVSLSTETAFQVNDGKTASLTVTPDEGYAIDSIDGTCGGVLDGTTYTIDAVTENCTVTATSSELDTDSDGVSDLLDNCPAIANADQNNLDSDANGDACDEDVDGDGVPNDEDRFDVNIDIVGDNPGNCVVDSAATKIEALGADADTAPATPINSKLTFRLLCDAGATALTRVSFGERLPVNAAAYKIDGSSLWTRILAAGIDMDTNTVTYHITDGGPLDQNGIVDGIIDDPVSVVSLPYQPVPLPLWMLLVMAGGIGLLGIRARQRFEH